MKQLLLGTDVKFSVYIEADGFDMATDNFTIDIMCRNHLVKHYDKSDIVYNESDDEWYLCIDTAGLCPAKYDAVVYVDIPDEDFGDGIRTEVYRETLMTVTKV